MIRRSLKAGEKNPKLAFERKIFSSIFGIFSFPLYNHPQSPLRTWNSAANCILLWTDVSRALRAFRTASDWHLENRSHDPQCEEGGIWPFLHVNNSVVTQPMCKWIRKFSFIWSTFSLHHFRKCLNFSPLFEVGSTLSLPLLWESVHFSALCYHKQHLSDYTLDFFQSHFKTNLHKLGEERLIA